MKQLALMVVVLFTASCALFESTDLTGALEADMERERLHVSGMEAFADVVTKASGWTEEQRNQVLAVIYQNILDYAELAQRSHVLLAEAGDIDWQEIAKQVIELYRSLDITLPDGLELDR